MLDHPDCVVKNGTSMPTPFIAGLVALMLEREPTLTRQDVVQRLKSASSIPGKPANTFDPKWGFGLVDASRITTPLAAKV